MLAVKICKKCGESNSEGSLMCVICGSSLKDASIEGTPNSAKEFSGMYNSTPTVCKHCNELLEQGSLKCKYCGTVATKRITAPRYYNVNTSNDGCATILLFIATFFVPIVGLIVGGIFAFSDDPNKQDVGKALLTFGLIMIVIAIIVGVLAL
jgi:RNA polymerase subunit RPABC4/transcription elongation factor Spt4